MGRNGPCFHCGINSTPLWRQGPTNKPVLCNACGTRYRLRGDLDNYFPKYCLPKELSCRNNDFNENSPSKVLNLDDDEKHLNPLKSRTPSKKHSLRIVNKRKTPMEKFHKQLLKELKYENIPNESSPEEALLFENVNNFIPSNEIGVGVVLLKP
ncbi:GATA transcription factor 26 [Lathyrus oleraceus]|uniref:GATA-type domain-containing protein n=1 Tax=Pisum sativum TaxID=3888 RepID=A0A9D4ZTW8_PEA|nr:GATA transcription factor 26-like [Pisum sativum]KAI5384636.1 hypothetical protein KIW84_071588 [Pisum sativum]